MRGTLISISAAMALAGVSPSAGAAESTVQPGYWHSVNRSTFVVSKTTEDTKCLTLAEVNAFMTNLSNRHYKCDYPTRTVAGGHLRARGKCVDKHGTSVDVDAVGEYGPDWFKIDARWSLDGLPISGRASTEAHRISATCPTPTVTPAAGTIQPQSQTQPRGDGDDARSR
jgi:hypothetical protein